jgi:CheY-like chemotaxis protein
MSEMPDAYSAKKTMDSRKVHTVLAVDDEPDMLALIEDQLAQLPFVVEATSSPATALDVLKNKEISVLVCDMNMPEIDGHKVLQEAKEANPNIISILVTGSASQADTIRAINEGGIWKYIAKPWQGNELADLVSEGARRYDAFCRQQANLTRLIETMPERPTYGPADSTKNLDTERYKLEEIIGEGGMGKVYRAYDHLLGMPVAIKVLSAEFMEDELAVSTLKEEARIAMRLSHRHIVRIHNLQQVGSHYFLVMEYVKGQTFRDIMNNCGRLPLDMLMQVIRVSSEAIAYAHRHHVLHKDLKPDNLMLSADGVLKVIDFGVSTLMTTQNDQHNIIGGTPAYMSPEQITGAHLDHRTDIYSMGVTAYELLRGRNPFPIDASEEDVLDQLPIQVTDIPEELIPVIEKAIHPDRKQRWDSIEQFASAIFDALDQLFCKTPDA